MTATNKFNICKQLSATRLKIFKLFSLLIVTRGTTVVVPLRYGLHTKKKDTPFEAVMVNHINYCFIVTAIYFVKLYKTVNSDVAT